MTLMRGGGHYCIYILLIHTIWPPQAFSTYTTNLLQSIIGWCQSVSWGIAMEHWTGRPV